MTDHRSGPGPARKRQPRTADRRKGRVCTGMALTRPAEAWERGDELPFRATASNPDHVGNRTIPRHPPWTAPILISGGRRLYEKGVENPGVSDNSGNAVSRTVSGWRRPGRHRRRRPGRPARPRVVLSAPPRTKGYEKLRLLAALGQKRASLSRGAASRRPSVAPRARLVLTVSSSTEPTSPAGLRPACSDREPPTPRYVFRKSGA